MEIKKLEEAYRQGVRAGKATKFGNCPWCGHRMWYSARLKYSKCARCGNRINF